MRRKPLYLQAFSSIKFGEPLRFAKLRFALLLPLFLLLSVGAKAQIQWFEVGCLNGLAANQTIQSICQDGTGNIYAAGFFWNSSGNCYVAKWNGTTWSELGGLNGLAANDEIYSICSDASGNIYAAGFFTNVWNNRYVAVWNHSTNTWSELGGLNGLAANQVINSICSDAAGNIYAAGDFTNGLSQFSGNRYVAKWDGFSWSEVGGLNGLSANGTMFSVYSDAAGNIYTAGRFQNASGKEYVAKYNGTSWSELGGLNGLAANYEIYTICSDALGNVYTAGEFTNGSSYTNGSFYVAKYNGTSWSELGGYNALGANGWIQSISCDVAGNIYAAGHFAGSSGNYVAKYNGISWSGWNSPNQFNWDILAISINASGNIFIGGAFTNSSAKRYVAEYGVCSASYSSQNQSACTSYFFNNHTLTSNGTYYDTLINYHCCDSIITLHLTITTSQTTYSQSISAGQSYLFHGHSLTTAGTYYDTLTNYLGCDSFITLHLQVYNCTPSWGEVGGVNALGANNPISCICSDATGNIYAAGGFTNGLTYPNGKRFVAKWNGIIWSEVGGLNGLSANSYIYSICTDASGNVYAAGDFTNASGKYYVAKWNGSTWSELGGLNALAANSHIISICADVTGNIYAAGNFFNSSGKWYVAKWNGSTWSELGGLNALAANNTIDCICSDAFGNIYAGGNFTNSAGREYVAKWNGSTWSELGGLNALAAGSNINSLCTDAAGNIYAAGDFSNLSNKCYVAKYNGSVWSELGGVNALAANAPIYSIYCDVAGNIYAAGNFFNASANNYVAKWNGIAWSELGGLNALAANHTINSISVDGAGNIYAGGSFSNGGFYSSGKNYVAQFGCVKTFHTITQTACPPYTFNNHQFTASGTYYDTLVNYHGADSIVTLHLTVQPLYHGLTAQTLTPWMNYTWHNTTYYGGAASGNYLYIDTFKNYLGCDSLIDSLIITQVNCTQLNAVGQLVIGSTSNICTGNSYLPFMTDGYVNLNGSLNSWSGTVQGNTSTGGTSPLYPFSNSITTPIYIDTNWVSVTITTTGYDYYCQSYLVQGQSIQIVEPVYKTPVLPTLATASVCAGKGVVIGTTLSNNYSYSWTPTATLINNLTPTPTASPTSNTTYTVVAIGNGGCSSSTTQVVKVATQTSQSSYSASISAGQTYLFKGNNLSTAGTYYDTLTNYLGCDSFITLHLLVHNCTASWSVLGYGFQGLSGVGSVCTDVAGNIYAAGQFTNSNGKQYVAKWNGTSWSELGGLNGLGANNIIYSICSDATGNIYAAGTFTNSSGNEYVAKFNGTIWSELGGLNGLAVHNVISSICADAIGNVYAAGWFTNLSGNRYVAKFNGTTWSELGGLNGLHANDQINSIFCDANGIVYAAGKFSNFNGKQYVAQFNGANWNELGGINSLSANSDINSICHDWAGNIYAAGEFTNGTNYLSGNKYVAKYNGVSWSELGGLNGLAANDWIYSICSDATGNIYAAGRFTNSGNNKYVAEWNGINWNELGGLNSISVNAPILNICSDASGCVYAGGWFTNAYSECYVTKFGSCFPAYNIINKKLCYPSTYSFRNQTLAVSGTYYDTLTNYHYADSIIILHLAFNTASSSSITQTICSNQTYQVGSHSYNAAGTYYDTVTNYVGCDSFVTLHLSIKPISNSSITASICANQTYTLPKGNIVSIAGTYKDTLSNYLGCDSIITTQLSIKPISNNTINHSICSYQSYTFHSHALNSSGTYYDTLTNYVGCDSIITLHLTVLPDSVQVQQNLCAGSIYNFNGTNISTAGTYRDTLHNQLGCDSIVVLKVIGVSTSSANLSPNICSNQSYIVGLHTYNTAGTYYDTLQNYVGCDSFIVTQLNIKPVSTHSFNKTICKNNPYTFHHQSLDSTGTYYDTLQNYVGCDSFITLHLTVKPISSSSFSQTICANHPYTFNGHALNSSGTYYDTLQNYLLCDSIITLHLTAKPISNYNFNQSICSNQHYLFNGHSLNTAGTYYDTLVNYHGCDSFITLHLSMKAISNKTINASTCSNVAYHFNGHALTSAGTYFDTLINHNGCDSFITLHLSIKLTSSKTMNQTICKNNPYRFHQQWLDSSGLYHDTLTNDVGCDSFITLHLTVRDTSVKVLHQSICSNQTYSFHQQALDTTGVYFDTLTNYMGCDSFVILHLKVLPTSASNIVESVCSNRPYHFNNLVIDSNGIYHDTIANYLGCDSVITATISMYPQRPKVKKVLGKLTAFDSGYDKLYWIDCDTKAFVSSANPFEVPASGNYAVVVTEGNCSDTSACVNVDIDCHLEVSPNPATDVMLVQIKCADKAFHILLTDVLGRELVKDDIANVDEFKLFRNNLPTGVYFLYLTNEHQVKMVKKVMWE